MAKRHRPFNVISHRARLNAERDGIPGNTLQAVRNLLDAHPHIDVELDARLTYSGLLPVAHDNRLEPFTDGIGFVNRLDPESLARVKVKCQSGGLTPNHIPELKAVLALFAERGHKGTLHLELKYGPEDPVGLLDLVLKQIKHYSGRVSLSSFNHAELLRVPPRWPIGVLMNAMPPDFRAYIKQFTANGRTLDQIAFHPDIWNLADATLAAAIDAMGMTVNAYTVPPSMFEWCLANGVNPITDDPAEALEFLSRQS